MPHMLCFNRFGLQPHCLVRVACCRDRRYPACANRSTHGQTPLDGSNSRTERVKIPATVILSHRELQVIEYSEVNQDPNFGLRRK